MYHRWILAFVPLVMLFLLEACGEDSTRVSEVDGMVEVFVPGGSFQMGSTDDHWEQPVHTVVLTPYWIDQTEVTNRMYALFVSAGACLPPSTSRSYTRDRYYGNASYDDYPVIWVSRESAAIYCAWAGRRLPTEAEWEYAAGGSEEYIYPWGNTFDGNVVNSCDTNCPQTWAVRGINDGYGDTAPVGTYPDGASPFGALDMAGNVEEWVADWWGRYPSTSQEDPQGPSEPSSGEFYVLRGGSWALGERFITTTSRENNDPASVNQFFVGFRCARSLY